MPTLDTVNLDALFTMFKGEPGTRKSTCALSYPTPQYWVSTDQKMESMVLPSKRWGIDNRLIEYDDYVDWSKPQAKLESLKVNCKYKTIIIDSATSMGDAMTSQVKKAKRTSGDGGKTIGGIPVSGLEEFNAESSAFQEMIAQLKDIHKYHKIHVIIIAHVLGARKDNDANKLTHHSRIIVTGAEKISAKLASYMTEVYHFNIKPRFEAEQEGEYGLFTVHTGNDYARTSLPLAREIMFNNEPLYEKFIKPGIDKLKAEKPVMRIVDTPPPTTNVTPFTKT
jgi:hypothetical protein